MRRSLVISGTLHAALLLWGLIAFVARPSEAPHADPLPVEFVSATQFSELTAGVKNAPKPIDNAKALADKVGEPKPAKELVPKAVDKPEIRTDSAPPEMKPEAKAQQKTAEKSEPKSEPKPDPKPKPKPEAKVEPKPAEPKPVEKAEKQDPPKDTAKDQIAEEIKKEEPKKPPKPEKKPPPEFNPEQIAQRLKRDEAKKPPRQAPKFDADQIAAQLDHREPQRQVATADTLANTAALGAPNGHAAQLSQSELDAFKRRLMDCWNLPPTVDNNSKAYVVFRVLLKPGAFLASEPAVVEDSGSTLSSVLTETGRRALLSCQPFTMLRPEHYDLWKDIQVKFSPEDMKEY
jgi:colicin import membrane protein